MERERERERERDGYIGIYSIIQTKYTVLGIYGGVCFSETDHFSPPFLSLNIEKVNCFKEIFGSVPPVFSPKAMLVPTVY